jgi:hypothetical protein
MMSSCRASMKEMIFMTPPHCGRCSGSAWQMRWMRMAQRRQLIFGDWRTGYFWTLPVAAHSTPRATSVWTWGVIRALRSWPNALYTTRTLP